MSEREADRFRPDRLKTEACIALVAEGREISADFKERLSSHDTMPTLFGVRDLAIYARSGLEVQVVQNLQSGSKNGTDALITALRDRGDAHAREQACRLVADRASCATVASNSVKKACHDAAPEAAARILTNQGVPANSNRVQLGEDLLGRAASGGVR